MPESATFIARARSDADDRLVDADDPLAGLQVRSGGALPGPIANPGLRDMVRRARQSGLRLAGAVTLQDDSDRITAWVEVMPDAAGEGCRIGIVSWAADPLPRPDPQAEEARRHAIVRHLAELSLRLGPGQEILTVDTTASELEPLAAAMMAGAGEAWVDFVGLADRVRDWRLLDGAPVTLPGAQRNWTAHLIPLGLPERGSAGFELHFTSATPLPDPPAGAPVLQRSSFGKAMGREIAPVLRQPISRIIANADTIRTQLAGPLAEEYSAYAADIASAGEHLLALIDDLADLEVVEDAHFSTAPDRIDLADVACRAAGILGVRARERTIAVELPQDGESAPAIGEFRRVLQILLNLLGNALRYSPEGSQVWLQVERAGDRARVTVADQGGGLTDEQQAKVFDKFERLGRNSDGGTGLGLYISRRLARAMDGDLTLESALGQGARFTLDLPADREA
jgi:hypothetical protein